jgi:hypothetical protein
MPDDVVTVRLSRNQAAFLQANLSVLAATTRQAMARPRMEPDRHMALGSRAIVLEIIEDVIRSAMLDVPNHMRKNEPDEDAVAQPNGQRHGRVFDRASAGVTTRVPAFSLRVV